jgi:hypothetical protein
MAGLTERLALMTLLMLLVTSAPCFGKCANRFIYVNAQIVGGSDARLRVIARVEPDPSVPQPRLVIQSGTVRGKLLFNSTRAERRRRDDCSRVPKTIELLLLDGERELDRARLDLAKDFIVTKLQDYEPRTAVTLRAR